MNIFTLGFRGILLPLDANNLYQEIISSDISIFVSSTFGNGEAPAMAAGFSAELKRLLADKDSQTSDNWLQNLNFSVFGLGSSAYPELAAFGKLIDSSLSGLGCNQLAPMGVGDELRNQKGSFQKWVFKAFRAAIKLYGIKMSEERISKAIASMNIIKQFKWDVHRPDHTVSINSALSSLHQHKVVDVMLEKRTDLHHEDKEPATLLLDFSHQGVQYEHGDHLGIFPSNSQEVIMFLKNRIIDSPASSDEPLVLLESSNGMVWRDVEGFPRFLLYDDLLTHVVDLSAVLNRLNSTVQC